MNKTELVERIAEQTEMTKASASRVVDAFIDTIKASLANGEEVAIPGFGIFGVGERAARTGRNPQTGATIQIAASTVVKFKAGKALKDAVNADNKESA